MECFVCFNFYWCLQLKRRKILLSTCLKRKTTAPLPIKAGIPANNAANNTRHLAAWSDTCSHTRGNIVTTAQCVEKDLMKMQNVRKYEIWESTRVYATIVNIVANPSWRNSRTIIINLSTLASTGLLVTCVLKVSTINTCSKNIVIAIFKIFMRVYCLRYLNTLLLTAMQWYDA